MALVVEICVQGTASALVAAEAGADRLELCEDLAVGGVTPSAGAIAVVCESVHIPTHVLIRPRGGDFVPSPDEFRAICRDIAIARDLGARGVVLGALTRQGSLDRDRTAELVALVRPMSVTFHRAFDAVPDPFATLEELIELGIDRVLTSGGAPTARLGLDVLARLQRQAGDRIIILAGGRVVDDDLAVLAGAGLREVHCGSAAGPPGATDGALVRRLQTTARAL